MLEPGVLAFFVHHFHGLCPISWCYNSVKVCHSCSKQEMNLPLGQGLHMCARNDSKRRQGRGVVWLLIWTMPLWYHSDNGAEMQEGKLTHGNFAYYCIFAYSFSYSCKFLLLLLKHFA